MKKTILFTILIAFISLTSFIKRAAMPQSTSLLYADVIFLGKVIKADTLGVTVAMQEDVYNASSNKNYLKQKEVYVPIRSSNKPTRSSYQSMPQVDSEYIFTLKYNDTQQKAIPFYYASGIAVNADDNTCNITGNGNYAQVNKLDVIKGIKQLRNCYAATGQVYGQQNLKPKSNCKLKSAKKNAAAKLWIEDLEKRYEAIKQ